MLAATPGREDELRQVTWQRDPPHSIRFHPKDWQRVKLEAKNLDVSATLYVVMMLRTAWDVGIMPKALPPPVVNPWQGKEIEKKAGGLENR